MNVNKVSLCDVLVELFFYYRPLDLIPFVLWTVVFRSHIMCNILVFSHLKNLLQKCLVLKKNKAIKKLIETNCHCYCATK